MILAFPDHTLMFLNPFKSNELSHLYQLEQSISVLRGVGGKNFHFYLDLNRIFCKQTEETLIRRRIKRRLVCTICQRPQKGC